MYAECAGEREVNCSGERPIIGSPAQPHAASDVFLFYSAASRAYLVSEVRTGVFSRGMLHFSLDILHLSELIYINICSLLDNERDIKIFVASPYFSKIWGDFAPKSLILIDPTTPGLLGKAPGGTHRLPQPGRDCVIDCYAMAMVAFGRVTSNAAHA